MKQNEPQTPEQWASATFGSAELGHQLRTDRLVMMAAALAKEPAASLPKAMGSWSQTLAAYRFLDNEQVSHEQIMMAHCNQTRAQAGERACVLLIADTTEINLSTHTKTKGRGPVGQGLRGKGFYVHSVHAVDAHTKELLGCAYQEPFVRQRAPKQETRAQRRQRARESQVWERSALQIGLAPAGVQWVHVGDRGADIYTFWQTCQQLGCAFVVRATEDRGIFAQGEDGEPERRMDHLRQRARRLPAQDGRVLHVQAEHDRKARDACLLMGYHSVFIQPPVNGACLEKTAVQAWVIRVWEPSPPQGVEALEWILISSVPVEQVEQAWERVEWYRCRWIAEDFHHALKTGCQMENRQVRSVEALFRLLGILTPIAERLLILRQTAQRAPETPAEEVLDTLVVQVVARLVGVAPETMSAHHLWCTIAGFGGYLNRKSDGPPGWKTLWQGWMYIQTLMQGVHLAAFLHPS
jgi:Transposase DNA-binding/Transposase DDE domain